MLSYTKRFLGKEYTLLIVYKLLLEYCYVRIQVPVFEYVGYSYAYNVTRIILGWSLALGAFSLLRYKNSNLYSLFIYIIFFVSIVPFIVIFQYCSKFELWMVLVQLIFIIFMRFLLTDKKTHKAHLNFMVRYDNKSLRFFLFAFLGLYFIYIFARSGVPSPESLLFENVYDIRGESKLPLLLIITQNFLCRIVIPLTLLIAIGEKKWVAVCFVILIQVYTFAVTGFKTYLFIPLMMIGLKLMPSLNLKRTILVALPLVLIAGIVLYKITDNYMLSAIFSDRIFFFPAYIKYCYFDFFCTNEFVYYSQNSIAKILGVHSNYETLVSYMIGGIYFDKPEMMTNTGYMADAYSNLGVIGILLMSLILAVVIRYSKRRLDLFPAELQSSISAIFIIFFYTLNDGHVINVLFSGGMLFVVLLISFIDFSHKKKSSYNNS